MTRIADSKPVTRETSALYRRRPLIITANAHELVIREKGRRDRIAVPYAVILEAGLKLRAIEAAKLKVRSRR